MLAYNPCVPVITECAYLIPHVYICYKKANLHSTSWHSPKGGPRCIFCEYSEHVSREPQNSSFILFCFDLLWFFCHPMTFFLKHFWIQFETISSFFLILRSCFVCVGVCVCVFSLNDTYPYLKLSERLSSFESLSNHTVTSRVECLFTLKGHHLCNLALKVSFSYFDMIF